VAKSIGESGLAVRAGVAPADIGFTGVGKAGHGLERAVPMGLKAINVESAGELDRVEALAAREGYSVSQFLASAAGEKLAVVLTMDYLRREAAAGIASASGVALRSPPGESAGAPVAERCKNC